MRELLHSDILGLESLLDHCPVEPCERVLDSKIRVELVPLLLIVNAMDLL